MRTLTARAVGVILLLLMGLAAGGLAGSKGWLRDWMEGAVSLAGATRSEAQAPVINPDALRADFEAARLELDFSRAAMADMETDIARLSTVLLAMQAGPDYAAMEQATVMVKTGPGHGSGVVIGRRTVMTAAHVVRGEKDGATVIFSDGTEAHAEVAWIGADDRASDFAVLSLDEDAPVAPTPLHCGELHHGDRLIAMGNPLKGRWVSTELRVASDRGWLLENGVVVQGPLLPGQSGGPVFTEGGRLVGLVRAMYLVPIGFGASASGMSSIYPASAICAVLPNVVQEARG